MVCVSLFFPAGLKQIHALSIQGNYELRIDLEDFENSTAYAQYGTFGVGLFSVDPDDDGYPLTVGDYSGNAGMRRIPNKHFSSKIYYVCTLISIRYFLHIYSSNLIADTAVGEPPDSFLCALPASKILECYFYSAASASTC